MAFSLTQFQGAFEVLDSIGSPYIIVSGQADDYWPETYLQPAPEQSFQWPQVLPEKEIATCKNRLIIQFRRQRLMQRQTKTQQPARRKSP